MKSVKKFDITCQCGHSKKNHEVPQRLKGVEETGINFIPDACYVGPIPKDPFTWDQTRWECNCPEYIPDNLKHIETIAKEKGLV